jgi:hypothetical protein
MPFWLVYMETYIDFLTPSFIFHLSKHHHHQIIDIPAVEKLEIEVENVSLNTASFNKRNSLRYTYICIYILYVYIYIYICIYTYICM